MTSSKTPLATDGGNLSEQGAKQQNNTRKFRQQVKQIIVLLAVRGLLPVACAEHLIARGGLRHD